MMNFRWRGVNQVSRTLQQIAPKEAERLLKQTVSAIATDVVREAKKGMNFTGPYSTGTMKRSVKKRVRRTRNQIVQNDVYVQPAAFYWRFYEYGDGDVPRRRMFGRAIDKVRNTLPLRFETLFMKKLVKRLERVGRAQKGRL